MQLKIYRFNRPANSLSFSPARMTERDGMTAVWISVPDGCYVDKEGDVLVGKSGEPLLPSVVLAYAIEGINGYDLAKSRAEFPILPVRVVLSLP